MIRRPPRSTQSRSSAASDVYKRQLHGRATRVDVTRALDTVEEHLNEQAQHPAPARAAGAQGSAHGDGADQHGDRLRRPGGWARRVRDVMTTSVVTVDRLTPYKDCLLYTSDAADDL